jgi:hypothetical protein
MLTLADRMNKFLYAAKTDSRESAAIPGAFQRALGDTPVNSITLDNGSGFARHRDISAWHNAPVYFAGPRPPPGKEGRMRTSTGVSGSFFRRARISVRLRKRNYNGSFP